MKAAGIATVALLTGIAAGAEKSQFVIDGDRIYRVVDKNAIRSIDSPRFAPASEASFMRPEEAVIGVVLNGEARAYSI